MDLRFVQSFVTTIECGSLAEAGRRLDLTAPAVAARIKALEEDLGAQLVRRAGRVVKATAAGLNIVNSARGLLRDERDLRALANEKVQLGEFRLGTFVSALSTILPPVLRCMYEDNPNFLVSVVSNASTELCRMVASGDLDAAIVVEPQFAMQKSCEWRPLMNEPLVVAAPAPLANRKAHDLLRTEPYIQYDRTVLGGQLAARYLRQHGITPRTRLEINGVMSIAAMIDEGMGVSLLPDWSALWARGLSIKRVHLPPGAPVRRTGLVWSPQGARAPISQMFLRHAENVFAQSGDVFLRGDKTSAAGRRPPSKAPSKSR